MPYALSMYGPIQPIVACIILLFLDMLKKEFFCQYVSMVYDNRT